MVVSVLTCGVHQSAGGRELRASGGLRAGEESGDGAGPLGWLGRGGPFPIFFCSFPFSFFYFLKTTFNKTFEIQIKIDSNQFE